MNLHAALIKLYIKLELCRLFSSISASPERSEATQKELRSSSLNHSEGFGDLMADNNEGNTTVQDLKTNSKWFNLPLLVFFEDVRYVRV